MLLIDLSTLWIVLILFILSFLRVCDRIVALKRVLEHLLFLQGLKLFGLLEGPFDMGNKQSRPINNYWRYLIPNFRSFSVMRKEFNALGNNNPYFSPIKGLFVFSHFSLYKIAHIILQHYEAGSENIVDQMTSTT